MKDFYIDRIGKHSIGNEGLLKNSVVEVFGREISMDKLEKEEIDNLRTLLVRLKNQIKINESPYDIAKIAREIQHSRSGMGGCALTAFTCLFCEEVETWMNTAVPNICKNCAEKMALNMVLTNAGFLKDQ